MPTPVSIDKPDADDQLVVNALGGTDTIDAHGLPAGLVALTLDGGALADSSSGARARTSRTAAASNDVALLGAGDDTFRWDPGDGSDIVEGQAGTDRLLFNGSTGSENFDAVANGGRAALLPRRRQHRAWTSTTSSSST